MNYFVVLVFLIFQRDNTCNKQSNKNILLNFCWIFSINIVRYTNKIFVTGEKINQTKGLAIFLPFSFQCKTNERWKYESEWFRPRIKGQQKMRKQNKEKKKSLKWNDTHTQSQGVAELRTMHHSNYYYYYIYTVYNAIEVSAVYKDERFFLFESPFNWMKTSHTRIRMLRVQEKKQQKPEWNFKAEKEVGGKQQKKKLKTNDRMIKKKYEIGMCVLCAWVYADRTSSCLSFLDKCSVQTGAEPRDQPRHTCKPPLRFLLTYLQSWWCRRLS